MLTQNKPELSELLVQGISELSLAVSAQQLQQLLSYAQLLLKWNKTYKLTAITAPREVIIQHLLDGLSLVPWVQVQRILDVGSGMGVPGIILAIMYPDTQVVVIDSNSKKSAFLRQVKIELNLTNLEVETLRVELYQPVELFPLVTSRAFANLSLFIKLAGHLVAADGSFLALKSEQGLHETAALSGWSSESVKLQVPFLDAQRFLIKMSRI